MNVEEVGGLHCRVRRASETKGELLYVHGLGESGRCFEELMRETALGGWNQWVPDLPGYGLSPRPSRPLTFKQQSEGLDTWMRKAGIRSAVLMGHSMGGMLGQIFAESFPHRVRGFVNVEGNITLRDCTYSIQAVERNGKPLQQKDFIESEFPKFVERIAQKAKDDRAHRGYLHSLKLCDPASFHLNSQELVQLSQQGKLAARLAMLQRRFPVLYVAGSPSGVAPSSTQLLRNNRVPIEQISDSGHWPFLDQPDSFLRCLANFLHSL